MPVTGTLGEKYASRTTALSFVNEQVEVKYIIHGSPDENDAKGVLLSQAPTTFTGQKGTLIAQDWKAEEEDTRSGRYVGTVTYNLPDWGAKETGETVFTFDTTGGTQHIIHSKANVARYPSGSTTTANAPDLMGMINVGASDIGGCDITVPAFAFTSTKYFGAASITTSYVNGLYNLTGKTNSAPWSPTIDGITLNFLEGEVLHLGATGSRRGIGDVEISQHFAGSQNATNLTVANLSGIAKKGWEYLWVMTDQSVSGTGSNTRIVCMPTFVYVEKVYDETDFTATGL